MIIKQISVFVENKEGRLSYVTDVLAKNNIDIRALSIADTTNFGILRLIVNKPDLCFKALKDEGLTVSITEVIAVSIDDKPGSFSQVLKILAEAGIDVSYVYAFIGHTAKASVILRVEDNVLAIKTLENAGVKLISEEELIG